MVVFYLLYYFIYDYFNNIILFIGNFIAIFFSFYFISVVKKYFDVPWCFPEFSSSLFNLI